MNFLTDIELLDVYLAATTLVRLHAKEGGLEQSRKHYEQKAEEYRQDPEQDGRE